MIVIPWLLPCDDSNHHMGGMITSNACAFMERRSDSPSDLNHQDNYRYRPAASRFHKKYPLEHIYIVKKHILSKGWWGGVVAVNVYVTVSRSIFSNSDSFFLKSLEGTAMFLLIFKCP